MQRVRIVSAGAAAIACLGAGAPQDAASARLASAAWTSSPHTVVVAYARRADLDAALRGVDGVAVVRVLPAIRSAELRTAEPAARLAGMLARRPGIVSAEPAAPRRPQVEPGLYAAARASAEWQYDAARVDSVPESVLHAAGAITIAVVDTGADLSAPALAAKTPAAYDVLTGGSDVRDLNGHGTFVASLAAGSVADGDGLAGFGGDARLLVIRAGHRDGSFTDVDEAAGIVYAVDHGAKIVNLSLGGPTTSQTEIRAVQYAAAHGVLLVAAAGNDRQAGNPVEYPAALLQPVGSHGSCDGRFVCAGLSVAASTADGDAASFSNSGSYISLAAPGVGVLGAVASTSAPTLFPRASLPGPRGGLYGYASGTSFAAPEVAGAAALVWAADPSLGPGDVARILEGTASGLGSWSPALGYGVIDVSAAVAQASGAQTVLVSYVRSRDRVHLTWSGPDAASYRVSAAQDSGPPRLLFDSTTRTDAWFRLAPGRSYTFTIDALAGDGTMTAASAPLSLRAAQAAASLSLAAWPSRRWRRIPDVRFAAVLRTTGYAVTTAARAVELDVRVAGTWRNEGTVATDALGRATWSLALSPGAYAARARFGGGNDLAGARSRPLRLVVAGYRAASTRSMLAPSARSRSSIRS